MKWLLLRYRGRLRVEKPSHAAREWHGLGGLRPLRHFRNQRRLFKKRAKWLFLESSTGFADPQGMKRGFATFFVLLNLQSTFLLGKSHLKGVLSVYSIPKML
jgi:hypothetical protein